MYGSERFIDVFKAKCQAWVNVLMISKFSSIYISFILIVAKFYSHACWTYVFVAHRIYFCMYRLPELQGFQIMSSGCCPLAERLIRSIKDYRSLVFNDVEENQNWFLLLWIDVIYFYYYYCFFCERISPFLFDIKHYFITFVYSCWFKEISKNKCIITF
jgi:hypothetical protein